MGPFFDLLFSGVPYGLFPVCEVVGKTLHVQNFPAEEFM
jgi:hypothetical protein